MAARDAKLPSDAAAALARAAEAGLAVELAALEVGSFEDEADPESGHGWMCRLADSGTLTVARFHRVRKAERQV